MSKKKNFIIFIIPIKIKKKIYSQLLIIEIHDLETKKKIFIKINSKQQKFSKFIFINISSSNHLQFIFNLPLIF